MVAYNSSVRSSIPITREGELPSYEIEVDLGIKKFKGIYQVTEFIENEKIVAFCKSNDMEFEDSYIFTEVAGGTKFEIIDRTRLKGLLAMSEFLLKPIMEVQMNKNLKTLLAILDEKYS